MNYALGRTEPTYTSAVPVLSICGTTFTLTRNIRNDDYSLSAFGQYPYDLNGPWVPVDLEDTGASSTVANTTVQRFSQTIESGQPRKFMRFQVSQ